MTGSLPTPIGGATLVKIVIILFVLLSAVPALALAERRIGAYLQNRFGPNRVGPLGLLQPLADLIKFMAKEEFVPDAANPFLFKLAPVLALIPSLLVFAVIPFGRELEVTDLNIGLIYVLAVASMHIYGILIAGWASNNKFSLLGGLRGAAQMISYEVSMGITIMAVVLAAGTLSLPRIVASQAGGMLHWHVVAQPLGALLFLVAMYAEANRNPFDLVEAEQELVGGFHTEYSSMKFAMFFMGEYINMVNLSALMVTLYLGGWTLPFLDYDDLPLSFVLRRGLSVLVFGVKVMALLFLFIWVRWTVPRFRYDQLMGFGWKTLIPLSLINLALVALIHLEGS